MCYIIVKREEFKRVTCKLTKILSSEINVCLSYINEKNTTIILAFKKVCTVYNTDL